MVEGGPWRPEKEKKAGQDRGRPPKRSKGYSSATNVAQAIQEAVAITHVPDLQLLVLDPSEFIETLEPAGEAEEKDASLISRRR